MEEKQNSVDLIKDNEVADMLKINKRAVRYILEGGIPAKNIDFGEAQSKFIDGDPAQI